MPTYRTSSRNQFRTPLGAVGDPPDVPGYLATFADDLDNFLGRGGAEDAATTAARNAIPSSRTYTDKRVRVAADGVTYIWDSTAWRAWQSDWATYTPTLTGITLGNGSYTAGPAWCFRDGLVFTYGQITLGSTSAVTGAILVSLPSPSASQSPLVAKAHANIGANPTPLFPTFSTTTSMRLRGWTTGAASGAAVGTADTSATFPATWASGNQIEWSALYRSA